LCEHRANVGWRPNDIGMLPTGQAEGEGLYLPLDGRRLRAPVGAVTSSIHPSGFDTTMPKALAICSTTRTSSSPKGESQRLAQALAGKGVMPIS
jgi:hypothetical protein